MNKTDHDGATGTSVSGKPDVTRPGKDSLLAASVDDRRQEVSTATEDKTEMLRREKLADVREDAADVRDEAAHLREDAADVREKVADSREGKIRQVEAKQEASDNHRMMLQQVNERLVITTIRAQELAEQLYATQAELVKAKLLAEKANLAKLDFLSSMSHELRTPLNAILGFAQLLESGAPPPTESQNNRLQQILKSGWFLLELINEILDLSVIESGKLSLTGESVLLADVMQECQDMVQPLAKKHGIQISFLPFDNTWRVNADRTRLKQVLVNLLTNAVKYNRKHGTVEVRCTDNTERIRISVRDSGAGLPPEKLLQLFQPFNRLGQEGGSEEGTGIGLVVAKQLVEQMGGTIGVKSTVGVGSEFRFDLARDLTPELSAENILRAEIEAQTQTQTQAQAHANLGLRTLLYVEDNPANLLLVEHIIEEFPQVHMLSARDGNIGIALARTHLPDVILMDINLPGISGIEAMNILHKDPATKHIPIVALSANAMPHDVEKGLEAGFFRYLTKPIKIKEFISALDNALKDSRKASAITTGQE